MTRLRRAGSITPSEADYLAEQAELDYYARLDAEAARAAGGETWCSVCLRPCWSDPCPTCERADEGLR